MNAPIYVFPGGNPNPPPPGHRPKRRRKNRDARKKDAEKKKEKEAEAGWKIYRKAMFQITVFAPLLIIPLSWSLMGLLKLLIVLQEINLHFIKELMK